MATKTELLRLMGLPVFNNLRELATLMHLNEQQLIEFNYWHNKIYRKYKIPKKTGGTRVIKQPRKDLKAVQAWILRFILDKLKPSPYATAYIKKCNIINNVAPHQNNRYFMCVDLENFFPSIKIRKVIKIFELIGYSEEAAKILANLCTCENSLPQGGVTSPALSNIVAARLDRRIAAYTARRNIIYTRYADDLTLSSNKRDTLCLIKKRIYDIIESEGYKVNEKKYRFVGPGLQCQITGLTKNNSEPQFGISRKKKKKMRAIIHSAIMKRAFDEKYPSEHAINGWLQYANDVDKKASDQFKKYLLKFGFDEGVMT